MFALLLSRLRLISSSLSFKLFLILFFSVVILTGAGGLILYRSWYRSVEAEIKSDAYRASDFIKQSLRVCMMENDREHIYRSIDVLGQEPGVEVIRIYNKRGEIRYSSVDSEIGRAVDLQAEACYACHASDRPLETLTTAEKTRVYAKRDGHRVLGLINPIRNSEGCSSAECHAHELDQSILGVLDVQMSMQSVDAAFAKARRQSQTVALAILSLAAVLLGVIVYYAVYLPTRRLRRGTETLAAGDLDVAIELNRSDELGALAESFNKMARNLKVADRELRAWSQTLEDRVKEKTEELEQIHQHIVQVEKAASLGKMAVTVAHELNNPLSGILTCAKLARRQLERLVEDGVEKQRMLGNLEIIQSESMRCGNVVRDLLTYARHGSAQLQPAHLHQLVERALNLVDHHIELAEVASEVQLGLAEDSIVCDGERIVQALIALLINAVEAMPDGGRLTLRTWEQTEERESLWLSVSDTGVGIPDDALGRIFDPFFSTKEKTQGVGLGLAVVYGIIQQHGGEISVASRPGEGTTFIIRLPRDATRTEETRETAYSGTVEE